MEDKLLQILVQGGLASVALVSLWINYKIVTNHLEHATDSNNKLENAISKLIQFLQDKIK